MILLHVKQLVEMHINPMEDELVDIQPATEYDKFTYLMAD